MIGTTGTQNESSSSVPARDDPGDELVQAANVLRSLPHSRDESDSICDDDAESDMSDILGEPGHEAAAMISDSYGRPRYSRLL